MRIEWIYAVICESAIKDLKYWIYQHNLTKKVDTK